MITVINNVNEKYIFKFWYSRVYQSITASIEFKIIINM